MAEAVAAFVEEWFRGCGAVDPDDIFGSTDWEGDDADEFIDGFSERFGVDLGGFVDVFHYDPDEPPMGRFRLLGPDGQKLERIPLTLAMLEAAARDGRWAYPYPPHEVKTSRVLGVAIWGLFIVMACLAVIELGRLML